MAKRTVVTKTLRSAPQPGADLAQWISGGATSHDLAIQQPNDLTSQRSDDLALQADKSKVLSPERTKSLVKRRDGERRQVNYYIGPQRALELKILAAERGETMAHILAQLIERWVEEPQRFALKTREALLEGQHAEQGPSLVARADGSNRYRVSVYLAPELATRFKVAALRAGREMSEVVDALAELHLAGALRA